LITSRLCIGFSLLGGRGALFLATGVAAIGLALAGRAEQATVEQTGDEGQANTTLVAKAGDVFSLQASVAGVKGGKNGHDGDGDGVGDSEGGGNHGLGDRGNRNEAGKD
jgi:hypothetical protein